MFSDLRKFDNYSGSKPRIDARLAFDLRVDEEYCGDLKARLGALKSKMHEAEAVLTERHLQLQMQVGSEAFAGYDVLAASALNFARAHDAALGARREFERYAKQEVETFQKAMGSDKYKEYIEYVLVKSCAEEDALVLLAGMPEDKVARIGKEVQVKYEEVRFASVGDLVAFDACLRSVDARSNAQMDPSTGIVVEDMRDGFYCVVTMLDPLCLRFLRGRSLYKVD